MKRTRDEKLKSLLKIVRENIKKGEFKELKKSVAEYFKTLQTQK